MTCFSGPNGFIFSFLAFTAVIHSIFPRNTVYYTTDGHSDIFCGKKPTSCTHSHLIKDVEASFSRIPHHHSWFFQKEVGDFPTIWLAAGTELNLKVFPLSGKMNVKKAQISCILQVDVYTQNPPKRGKGCFNKYKHSSLSFMSLFLFIFAYSSCLKLTDVPRCRRDIVYSRMKMCC